MAASRISQIAAHLNFPKGMLAGQVAIITGSGQGIGAEAARLFANEGALVVVSDIDAKKATSVAEGINSAGGRALAVPGDMLDSKYIQTLVEKAAEFGSGKIHIIVNNAGMYGPAPPPRQPPQRSPNTCAAMSPISVDLLYALATITSH